MTIREVVTRWLDAAIPHRQGPQIGRVLSFDTGENDGICGARIRILTPGSLEETDRIIEDVPVAMIWSGPASQGVYTPLAVGTLVVVGYVEHNPSYPYLQGIWGEFSGLTKLGDLFTELSKNVSVLQAMVKVMGGTPVTEPGNGAPSAFQSALSGALAGKPVGDFSSIEGTVVRNG